RARGRRVAGQSAGAPSTHTFISQTPTGRGDNRPDTASDTRGETMESKIVGTVMPVLELNMQPNEKVFAESGQLAWMSMALQMQTSTSAGGQQGGFMGALGRAMAGGTLFMTEYTAVGGPGLLAFAAKLPGQVLPMEITPGQGYMVHRHGFMCATLGVQFSIAFQQRLGAGIFGGTGFRMQRLQGQGRAWVELHGE